jgi:hypothetical protein
MYCKENMLGVGGATVAWRGCVCLCVGGGDLESLRAPKLISRAQILSPLMKVET